jgi:hypothetical protein
MKKRKHERKKIKALEAHNEKLFQDCFNLDETLAKWILPRLKYLKEYNQGMPTTLTPEEWDVIQDKMIYSFEFIVSDDSYLYDEGDEQYERYKEGLVLFGKYLGALWI